jgi:hypothetical protein
LKPFSSTMFWAPPMGIYVGIETSFILGFATDLYVVFGPCHKDNVAVVTKDCLIYVSISISVSESESESVFKFISVSVIISEYV